MLLAFYILMNSMTYSSYDTFFTINNVTILVKRSYFTLAFFKDACHDNPGMERKWTGSNSHISRHISGKFLNTSAKNNIWL